ncbi:MAG TPA: hypothetical protein VHC69_29310 [Polyangiaceae bacterium]|nr:hypothetical protein [Polyangiaceae bacterium]
MKNACFTATIALLSGCSLINSLDSVKPATEESDAGNGAHAGKGGKGSGGRSDTGGSGGMADTGGASGKGGTGGASGGDTGVAGMDASAGGSTPDSSVIDTGGADSGSPREAGAGGTDGGNFTPGGPNGAIVAYDPDGLKTWVLDPTDAHLVSSETSLRILAIANDPATDYWYIFRQPGKVTDPAELQVRQLNTTNGQWHDVGLPVAVPNPATPTIGVLNQRLAYLSTPVLTAPNPATSAFTVLDTSNPEAVTVTQRNTAIRATGPSCATATACGKIALTARASTTGPGGTVTIAAQQLAPCDVAGCSVSVFGETINSTTVKEDATTTMVGYVNTTGGNMGFASAEGTNEFDVVVMPPSTLAAAAPATCTPDSMVTGTAAFLDSSHSIVGTGFGFDIDNLRVNAAGFDPCHNIAFGTSLLGDTAIWAIPMMSGGTPQKLCTKGGGGTLLYEAFTHGVLRVTPDDNRFELYDIDATDPASPKLSARTLKFPPLFVNKGAVLAVRRPKTVCK